MFSGALFPFVFITIACGALSGFHSLIASGTTPKMIEKETQVRMIGYGAMLMESFVAVMALIAACVIEPGLYFAMNSPAGFLGDSLESASEAVAGLGFTITPDQLQAAAAEVEEQTLVARTGGAPTLAVGMSQIFSSAFGAGLTAFFYHFAIMFEALFILTTVDAGTRVGRFMLQDTLGNMWKPIGRVSWAPGVWLTSAIVVGCWGYFLYTGVTNPLGGINQLFPLFGIANQLLAAVALSLATTLLIKHGKIRWAWITAIPLAWDAMVTLTASFQKVFSSDPRVGFFTQRNRFQDALDQGEVLAARQGCRRNGAGRPQLDDRRAPRCLLRGPDHHRDRELGSSLGACHPRRRVAADDRSAVPAVAGRGARGTVGDSVRKSGSWPR